MIHVSRTSSAASASTKHVAYIVRDWLCRAHEVTDPCRYIVTWIVGKPDLTGLWKDSPSLGLGKPSALADQIDNGAVLFALLEMI